MIRTENGLMRFHTFLLGSIWGIFSLGLFWQQLWWAGFKCLNGSVRLNSATYYVEMSKKMYLIKHCNLLSYEQLLLNLLAARSMCVPSKIPVRKLNCNHTFLYFIFCTIIIWYSTYIPFRL